MPKLSSQSSAIKVNENGETFMSLYSGGLTVPIISSSMAKIKASFPALPVEFFTVLSNRIKENGFSDARLNDAVAHVIDNCIYPTPTIAQFISFDKKVRLLTYHQMLDLCDKYGGGVWDTYEKKKIGETMFWYSKAENANL